MTPEAVRYRCSPFSERGSSQSLMPSHGYEREMPPADLKRSGASVDLDCASSCVSEGALNSKRIVNILGIDHLSGEGKNQMRMAAFHLIVTL